MALLNELPANHDIHHLTRSLPLISGRHTAIDVGAHQGIWTKELLKHFKVVYAFEPQIHNYAILNRQIGSAANTYNAALGHMKSDGYLAAGKENTGQYHLSDEGQLTNIRTLDSYKIQNVDLIKYDVEGFELFALKGSRETILKYHPAIILEENGLCRRYGVEPFDAEAYLYDLGYRRIKQFNKDYLYL